VPQPPEVDALSEALRKVYADAWAELERRAAALAEDWGLRRRARYARIRELRQATARLVAELDAQARAFALTGIPEAYALGGRAAVGIGAQWTTADAAAIQELAQDLYRDLLKSTRFVRRDVKRFIAEVTREKAGNVLVLGQPAEAAGREVARFLADHGIHAVRYADGSLHGLADYAGMAIRTKTALAYNAGTLNKLGQAGVGFVEVFDGPSCGWTSHNDTDLATGTIRPIADAVAYPISHPRCQRSFGGRPDLATAEDAAKAKPFATDAQRADPAAAEQERLAATRARTNARARARAARRG